MGMEESSYAYVSWNVVQMSFIFNLVFNIFGPLCACKHAFNKLLNYGRFLLLLVEFCYNIGIDVIIKPNIQVYSNILITN